MMMIRERCDLCHCHIAEDYAKSQGKMGASGGLKNLKKNFARGNKFYKITGQKWSSETT
jgi:hypothetical protein